MAEFKARNTLTFRFEVLRDNAVFAELVPADESAEVAMATDSELKMSFRGAFLRYRDDIDFLRDRLRPVAVLNGRDYPLGTYIVTTEAETSGAAGLLTEIEGYSVLYLAKRKRIEERLNIARGGNYIGEIVRLLNGCGIDKIDATPADYTFPVDREDWDVGTPVLEIVNQLLGEISYNTAWTDLSGVVRLTPYETPGFINVDHSYCDGEYSVISPEYKRTSDRFAKSNVFLAICESPDLPAPISAKAENNSPDSPFSVANIGRILHVERVDGTPSQAALQRFAERLVAQSLQETETVEFSTAIVPEHETFETVALQNGDLTGIYAETEWRIPLTYAGQMTHRARRVIASA